MASTSSTVSSWGVGSVMKSFDRKIGKLMSLPQELRRVFLKERCFGTSSRRDARLEYQSLGLRKYENLGQAQSYRTKQVRHARFQSLAWWSEVHSRGISRSGAKGCRL